MSDEDSEVEETDNGLFIGPDDDEMPVENSEVPTISSDKWIKMAHLHELQSVETRGGSYKINPLTTLPQFTPGQNNCSGSLVQKVEHEVPTETVDQCFQLTLTP